jgi:hypothetical protein
MDTLERDIVDRSRGGVCGLDSIPLCDKAANEIERFRREVEPIFVYCIDIEVLIPSPGWQPDRTEPEAPTEPVVETYVVRTWRMYDTKPFKFLAIAGRDRAYIESLAWPLFEPRR